MKQGHAALDAQLLVEFPDEFLRLVVHLRAPPEVLVVGRVVRDVDREGRWRRQRGEEDRFGSRRENHGAPPRRGVPAVLLGLRRRHGAMQARKQVTVAAPASLGAAAAVNNVVIGSVAAGELVLPRAKQRPFRPPSEHDVTEGFAEELDLQ